MFDFRGHVILPATARAFGIRHVAGGLLQVRHQAAPLEHLGQDVRHAFAGDVGAAELRDRIVAVLAEHAGVEFIGALGADRACVDRVRGRDLAEEFVEEEAAHRLCGSRIACEERAFDSFGEIGQREDGAVGVGEIGREGAGFVGGECLGCCGGEAHGGRVFYLACRAITSTVTG